MIKRNITVLYRDTKRALQAFDGQLLADVLSDNGYTVNAACGRKGVCGKCSVRLAAGTVKGEEPDAGSMIRSCKASVCADAVIELTSVYELPEVTSVDHNEKTGSGIAVDIGTTTVEAALISSDGAYKTCSVLNPQVSLGADVISRIDSCAQGKLERLHKMIIGCVSQLINRLDKDRSARQLTVCGNTVMLHLFCGCSPVGMGSYPFEPQFTSVMTFNGSELGLPIDRVTVLPSVCAFIGSDTVAGIYALGLHETEKRLILADLGTNGEIVLSDRGRLICTSAAAGPALEGACIECGTGGIGGAISHVSYSGGELSFETVSDAEPIGLCGSGLADTVAYLLKKGLMDETGAIDRPFYITDRVYVSPKDVRQFQLAKSAICSAIEILLETAGLTTEDIDGFYIAGGLGNHIDPESALISSLIPAFERQKILSAGNAALKGALMCLTDTEALGKMSFIAEKCTNVDLAGTTSFCEKFMQNMFFRRQTLR